MSSETILFVRTNGVRSSATEYDARIEPEAFDAWHAAELAAAERRGAVKALREEADRIKKVAADKSNVFTEHVIARHGAVRLLRETADQMERED